MKMKCFILFLSTILLFYACSNKDQAVLAKKVETSKHLLLGSIEYVKAIQIISRRTGNSTALATIMVDVDKFGADLDHNDPDNIQRFYNLISSLVYRIGTVDMQTHYFRNKLNRAPATLNDMIRINHELPINRRWRLFGITNSEYHIQGVDGEYNLKFVSYNGFCEAVYNKKGVLLNESNDPINMGTFNYAAGILVFNSHSRFDVAPYLKWGNSLDSPQKGSAQISKAINVAYLNYKKNAASVYLYRKSLFGMQQGTVP